MFNTITDTVSMTSTYPFVPVERYDAACAERDRLRKELLVACELSEDRLKRVQEMRKLRDQARDQRDDAGRKLDKALAERDTAYDCLKQSVDGCGPAPIARGTHRAHHFDLGARPDLKITITGAGRGRNEANIRVDRLEATVEERAADAVRSAGVLGSKQAVEAIKAAGLRIVSA